MPEVNPEIEAFAKIKVIGVGGGGSNALNRMMGVGIQGVDFVAVNTDAQDLHHSQASQKVHLGKNLTRGLGAGMNPEIGRKAAEESKEDVFQAVNGAHMIFITCGLGGGTGSGASPVIAQVAKESGALTVAVVTKPFTFEGAQRKRIAEESLEELKKNVDTVITIPNDKILNIIDKNTSIQDAFAMIDDVLRQGVQGISDLITIPGLINVDFADVSTIMRDTGSALMGIGTGTGEERAVMAAKMAINSPLLDPKIDGAKGVLFNISGGTDLGMVEINEAASVITESIDPNAKVIFGAVVNPKLKEGEVKVTVIATGFGDERQDTTKRELKASSRTNDQYPNRKEEPRKKIGALNLPHEDRDYKRDYRYEDDETNEEDEDYYEPYVPKKHDRPRQERDIAEDKQPRYKEDNQEDDLNDDEDDEFAVPAFIRNKLKN